MSYNELETIKISYESKSLGELTTILSDGIYITFLLLLR